MRNCHLRRGMTRERAAGKTRRGRCKKWEREETRRVRERKLSGGWRSARGAGLGRGRRRGRLCRLFVLCRVAAISHTSSAASSLASELTPSPSSTNPATHPATYATLLVEILRILESRMEKRTSLREREREREKRDSEKVERKKNPERGLPRCDF